MISLAPAVAVSEMRPAMERALGKLVLDDCFREDFFRDPVVASLTAQLELTEREREALARIRPGALAAFRRYLDSKWTWGLDARAAARRPHNVLGA